MARTINYDPGTSEARSSWIVGLTEACNKLTGVLDMQTDTLVDEPLPELYISEDDRYRIYQVGTGKKLWLSDPVPVIKKNGVEITESADGFAIDNIGGSVAFEDNKRLTAGDILTVSATYIVDQSNTINDILSQIDDLADETERYKGSFSTVADLRSKYATGNAGDFAVITTENAFYTWNTADGGWAIVHSELTPQGTSEDSDWYYYGGRNTWQDIRAKVLGCVLTGLDTTTAAKVEATDSLLTAFGKLQAQINDGTLGIKGEGSPTTQTVGRIGQDYIDTAAGKKYHLVNIDVSTGTQKYIWEQYANISDLPNFDSTPTSGSENGVTSDGVYKALQEAQTTADGKYMATENPVGTGAFSMNRKANTTVGEHSATLGSNSTAVARNAIAMGSNASISTASAINGIAIGQQATVTQAGGIAIGNSASVTRADGMAIGLGAETEAATTSIGPYNFVDFDETPDLVAAIGNGGSSKRSDAFELDFDGNGWFAGDVYVGSTSGTHKDDGAKRLASINEGVPVVTAESTDGVNYTATIGDGYEVKVGSLIIIIPATVSTSVSTYLSVNNEKKGHLVSVTSSGEKGTFSSEAWMYPGYPLLVVLDDDGYWEVISAQAPDVSVAKGVLPIANGGTGTTSAARALVTLGAQARHTHQQVTLSANASYWTVSIDDLPTNASVFVNPDLSSTADYLKAGIVCTTAENNQLSFTSERTLDNAVTVDVFIFQQ